METGPDVGELHLLELALVVELGVAGIVVQHLPVPVLFGGPQVVPVAPVAVVVEVDGEKAMEVRQPLLGEGVHGQRCADGVRNAPRALPQLREVRLEAIPLREAEEVARHPQFPLALVGVHHLPDRSLEILQHFEFGQELPRLRCQAHGTFSKCGNGRNGKEGR